ncbi:hypothetical protein Pint_14469 [Pistacia integerrima]|uniref:Uncharacterized protein n=1 Tax=Pistacia integerrima TaxID=434235 RepID=A0ACC0YC16_9ROSI|nr:hypothetical protein Pint_14469 [Pistacia integerrima]
MLNLPRLLCIPTSADFFARKKELKNKQREEERKRKAEKKGETDFDMAMRGGAIKFLGTKRHHDKWLKDTENYVVKGCFAMTELGHGSNVKGIETVTTYDSNTGEFVINTPCESAQKYCIGGAANVRNFSFFKICMQYRRWSFHSLELMGKIKGFMHSLCRWFDNVRIPKENLLNSIADVSPDGEYLSAIRDPNQRFALSWPL